MKRSDGSSTPPQRRGVSRVSVFKHQEPIEPTPIVASEIVPKKVRKRKKSTTRSTQIVRNIKPKLTGAAGIFISSSAQSVSYKLKLMIKASLNNLNNVALLDLAHGNLKHGNTMMLLEKSNMRLT